MRPSAGRDPAAALRHGAGAGLLLGLLAGIACSVALATTYPSQAFTWLALLLLGGTVGGATGLALGALTGALAHLTAARRVTEAMAVTGLGMALTVWLALTLLIPASDPWTDRLSGAGAAAVIAAILVPWIRRRSNLSQST